MTLARLTERELAMLELAAHGKTYVEIGRELGVSWHTAKNTLHTLRQKWHVPDTTYAVALAVRDGMFEVNDPDEGYWIG